MFTSPDPKLLQERNSVDGLLIMKLYKKTADITISSTKNSNNNALIQLCAIELINNFLKYCRELLVLVVILESLIIMY